ncbi:MAG: nucleotidyltransferase family protein [Acetobacteraceae bacterium]|nr:nucleotidyltransferase family protein [Acetobacteraceae bacterium]MBV8588523.1 nucleotidyltransferase family protein [Acetobacteraceae bacterium]
MEAIILAGGLGTRLRSRVANTPKPMALVAGRPFLEWLLQGLAGQGFSRVILAVSYLREQVMSHFGSHWGGINISYAVEPEPLGTGGAIRHALAAVVTTGPVFVFNGDTIAPFDSAEMLAAHRPGGVTMALVGAPDCTRYGAVEVEGGRIAGFCTGSAGPGLINAGIYLLGRDTFDGMTLPQPFSFENDFIRLSLDRVRPCIVAGWFLDIGVPSDYDRAQTELPRKLGQSPRRCPAPPQAIMP